MIYQMYVREYSQIVCYYILANTEIDQEKEFPIITDLLTSFGQYDVLRENPVDASMIIIGPRPAIETPSSSEIVSMCHHAGLTQVTRVEKLVVYQGVSVSEAMLHHDTMTSQMYTHDFDPEKVFRSVINTDPALQICHFLVFKKEGVQRLKDAGMSDVLAEIWYEEFLRRKRSPTGVELFQIVNGNTEHSRHGFFNALLKFDDVPYSMTLFEDVMRPYALHPEGVVIAFHDNASAVEGGLATLLSREDPSKASPFMYKSENVSLIFTAETHNFPTTVEPYQGATTGLGGMLRDLNCAGKGSHWSAAFAGYIVDHLRFSSGYCIPGEARIDPYPKTIATGREKYTRGLIGVANYGNCAGIPTIAGFSLSFDQMFEGRPRANQKCVLYAGGIGTIRDENIEKKTPQPGDVVIQIGGPAYNVGFGGGLASSGIQEAENVDRDFNAVQRGNPAVGNPLKRVTEGLAEISPCFVLMAHDQGAVGPCNAVTEAIEKTGALIDIRQITAGDSSMTVEELWGAEYQERNTVVVPSDFVDVVERLCKREGVNCDIMGEVNDSGRITLIDSANPDKVPVDLNLDILLKDLPQEEYSDITVPVENSEFKPDNHLTVKQAVTDTWRQLAVGFKGHVVYRKDRTVRGHTVQAQTLGPLDFPLSDYGLMSVDPVGTFGESLSLGQQSPAVTLNCERGARMTLAECLLNSAGVVYDNPALLANWMWPAKRKGQNVRIARALHALSDACCQAGIPIVGGKDSLSMINKHGLQEIFSLDSLVLAMIGRVPKINNRVTALLQDPDNSVLGLIDLTGQWRLGGSSFAQSQGNIGSTEQCPDVNPEVLVSVCKAVGELINDGLITACHDTVGEGMFTAAAEMAMAANVGMQFFVNQKDELFNRLFAQEAKLLVEFNRKNCRLIEERIVDAGAHSFSQTAQFTTESDIELVSNGETLWRQNLGLARGQYAETDRELVRELILEAGGDVSLADEEHKMFSRPVSTQSKRFHLSFTPIKKRRPRHEHIKLAVIRDRGSNGEMEMAHFFKKAGFNTVDVLMEDILVGGFTLTSDFHGIAFVGGFSSADVLGAGVGWASKIRHNKKVFKMFKDFFERDNTFAFGVCNGCQLMSYLIDLMIPSLSLGDVRLVKNRSHLFESRLTRGLIPENKSILFEGMNDSILSYVSAHGEGRFEFSSSKVQEFFEGNDLVTTRFVDFDHKVTEQYPRNPNGSPNGIAGLTSPCGRFTMMMPHPERETELFALQHKEGYPTGMQASPHVKMAHNAMDWVLSKL